MKTEIRNSAQGCYRKNIHKKVVETASKLTSCDRSDTTKIFQKISIVVAIAFGEFLQIENLRNSTLTFNIPVLPTLLQEYEVFVGTYI